MDVFQNQPPPQTLLGVRHAFLMGNVFNVFIIHFFHFFIFFWNQVKAVNPVKMVNNGFQIVTKSRTYTFVSQTNTVNDLIYAHSHIDAYYLITLNAPSTMLSLYQTPLSNKTPTCLIAAPYFDNNSKKLGIIKKE